MKFTLHLSRNIFSLACIEPIASDTDLKGEKLEVLKERVFKGIDCSFGLEILSSGLIEAATFPPAVPCPKLVRECIVRYDPIFEIIKRDNGETLLAINWKLFPLFSNYLIINSQTFFPPNQSPSPSSMQIKLDTAIK